MRGMPQDTPTTPSPSASDLIVGYYPAEFATELDAALDNASSLTLRRMRPGKQKVLYRERLQVGTRDVWHGTRTERSPDEIAAQLFALAEGDADSECSGNAVYRVSLCYAKPPAGKTASPRDIELRVGQILDSPEVQARYDLLQTLLAERQQLFGQTMSLLEKTAKVAASVATMAEALSNAFGKLHVAQSEVASRTEMTALLAQQIEQDRMRFDAFKNVLTEAAPMVRAQLGLPAPQQLPAPIGIARKLALSMQPSQLAILRRDFPRLLEAGTVRDEPSLVLVIADCIAGADKLDALIDTLSPEQQALFEQLIAWAQSYQPPKLAV